VLFLEAVRPAGEQARQFALVDDVEQLAADAAVPAFVAGLLISGVESSGDAFDGEAFEEELRHHA
jgi:hypothetical protein